MSRGSRFQFGVLLLPLLFSACRAADVRSDYDPLEPVNRKVFWLNNQADRFVIEPVAKGYDVIVPNAAQSSVAKFFRNLWFPVNFINNVLQGKPVRAGGELGRFVINTTVGIGGLFDPASSWGLEAHPEDFGQTFAVWGVRPGPYIVLPFFGPSNGRDAVGLLADYGVVGYPTRKVDNKITYGAAALNVVNTRSRSIGQIETARTAALDEYVFLRDAYFQNRQNEIRDGEAPEASQDDDLYGDDLYDDEAFDEDP